MQNLKKSCKSKFRKSKIMQNPNLENPKSCKIQKNHAKFKKIMQIQFYKIQNHANPKLENPKFYKIQRNQKFQTFNNY